MRTAAHFAINAGKSVHQGPSVSRTAGKKSRFMIIKSASAAIVVWKSARKRPLKNKKAGFNGFWGDNSSYNSL
jgi:hypothetical protein